MKTNTVVIINGSFGDEFYKLKNNLKGGFYYLGMDPVFVNGQGDLKEITKYSYLVYISLNDFGKDQYESIKDNYVKTLFVTDEILTKPGIYRFFNNLQELYGIPFTEHRQVELRIKGVNYLTNFENLIKLKEILIENNIPITVSVKNVIQRGKENIPITRNKQLIKELYNGQYVISNNYDTNQIVINIEKEDDIENLFYLKELKNYDVLIEVSNDLEPFYLKEIIMIINNQNGRFVTESKTEVIDSKRTFYDTVRKNSEYFSFFLIFSILLFIYIFYRLYRKNKNGLF